MIDVKDATRAAEAFVRNLFPSEELRDVRLEEVELSGDERSWIITLGWADPTAQGASGFLLGGRPRVYKSFDVDARSGVVRSMKMRSVK